MTDNPFEGMGGFDMNALLQQAQQMQDQVTQAQARLGDETVQGAVAGGAVTVTLNGLGDLVGVTIRPGTVDGDSADDLADLGDLLVAAYRDAKTQADRLAAEALGPFGSGGLPGLG